MPMNSNFYFSNQDGALILRVNDLLSEVSNADIMKAVEERIAEGFTNFVVDLSSIDYMNSVGINFLIKMKHRAKATGGLLAVVHASAKVKQLLDVTKLRPMFVLTDSLDEALQFMTAYNG